ncbi:unnamed protein product [Adineta ricciae]|uniref:Phospholipid/glycerol acyltransferase domain-containing protein n=1 Tax=Adineta ricciae TaxID=249248 RepID=A0A815CY82_ADIRI|nr:unnamed protein product [Adineta ricciae]
MNLVNSLKGLFFYLFLTVAALFTLIFAFTPAASLIFIHRQFHFRICSFIVGHFLLVITCLLEDFLNIRVVITGDELTKPNVRSIILLNHRTRLDWMYIWMLQSRFKLLDQLKIALKSGIKRIPIIGWGCYHNGFLFLHRQWEKDQDEMKKTIEYYKSSQTPVSLLIFPEGTNLHNKTKLKSNTYASKQTTFNRPYEYCLHPHTTGFTYLLKTMRSNDIIDTVDDITIGYEGEISVTELDLLKGHFPKIIHFHIKRYDVNELPEEDEQVSEWLKKCWDEKENRLEEFYTTYQFDLPSKRFRNHRTEANVQVERRLALLLLIIFIIFWSYCFVAYTSVKLYVLAIVIFQSAVQIIINVDDQRPADHRQD